MRVLLRIGGGGGGGGGAIIAESAIEFQPVFDQK